jgi:uncharacterized membrane protein YbhN (UPF0104 family)
VLVPVPGGVGALEGAVHEAYKLVGAPGGLGLLAASAYRVTAIVVALLGAVYYFSARKQIKKFNKEQHTSEEPQRIKESTN